MNSFIQWNLVCLILLLPSLSLFFLYRLSLGIPLDTSSINGHSRCSMYAVNFTQLLADNVTKPDPNWPNMPCQNGWEFDKDEVPYTTISTEVSFGCSWFTFFSVASCNQLWHKRMEI